MKKIVLVLVSLMMLGCALDSEFKEPGTWGTYFYSIDFISESVMSVGVKEESMEYTYYIDNRHIYIKDNNSYIDYYRVIQWDNENLIIRDQRTLNNYKLEKSLY